MTTIAMLTVVILQAYLREQSVQAMHFLSFLKEDIILQMKKK